MRLQAIEKTAKYYIDLYGDEPSVRSTRENFAMKENTLPKLEDRQDLAKFFFWTEWTASAKRPNTDASYTNNWPHEPLINNVPTPENIIWSIASVVFLVLGIGAMIWVWSFKNKEDDKDPVVPAVAPLTKIQLAPIINGGKDPKFQKLGVDILFWALVVLVVGSFTGSYLAIAHIIPQKWSFLFGHQGYEFIDLGRFWQGVKYAGILFWLVLMVRSTIGAFKQPSDKNLLALFFASVIAIGLFYGPALFYGEHTHLSVMEYWHWWVVHLWVEGFFEVFSVAAL